MLFSSMLFLWIFLPAVLAGYYIIQTVPSLRDETRLRLKNGFLLAASLVFYAWGGVYYLLLIFAVILINYTAGLFIDRAKTHRKAVLCVAVFLNLSLLFFFKYFNLAVKTAERLSGLERGALGFRTVVLPIGISFYIFQAMSYVIDLYRGETDVQKNPLRFALYVSLFPQLIAGPIVMYKDVAEQLTQRTETRERFVYGIRRFSTGLAKKVLIADTMAQVADNVFAMEPNLFGAPVAWWGMFAYTMQIYFDFSGYSDMAIGLGHMFGFSFKENFARPYQATSVRMFWRRWHISLSSWFRDYLYIPLGGNRKGEGRTCLNLFLTFLFTGIWHGANYTFFAWGVYYAVFVIAERLLEKRIPFRVPKVIGHIYTMLVVMVGWVLFRADHIRYAYDYVLRLVCFDSGAYTVLSFLSMRIILCALAAVVIVCLPERKEKESTVPVFAVKMVLLALCMALIISGSYSPFIYYQF